MIKKFIIKSSIFLALSIILLLVFNYLYTNTNQYKYGSNESKFYHIPENIELCNFGSSHGNAAFNYKNLNVASMNFALGSQGYFYDKRILIQYLDKIEQDAIVFIPISYQSFYESTHTDLFKEKNIRYHKFLDKNNIIDFSYSDYFKYQILPIIGAGDGKYSIFHDIEITNNKVFKNPFEEEKLEEMAKRRAYGHLIRIEEGTQYTDECYNELEEMIEICQNNDIKVVLVTTPFTKYYNQYFNDEFFNNFYSRIGILQSKYNVPYFDYSHMELFSNNIDMFLDNDHLNDKGSAVFMSLIIDEISNLGYLD